MKRLFLALATLSLAALVIIIGCDTRSPSNPNNTGITDVASLEIIVPPLFKAPSGTQSVDITVIAKDANGVGVQGVEIDFYLSPGLGTISSSDSVTDENGILTTAYGVNLTTSIEEVITARATNTTVEASDTVKINLLDQIIQTLDVLATEPVLYIGASPSIQDTIKVTVVDENNNGISGLYVNMSSIYGAIANTDTTDLSGVTRAVITFNNSEIPSTVNAITTWIKASIGTKIDSTQITVIRQQNDPTTLALNAVPSYMLLAQGDLGVDTVKATVTDDNGVGVAGITVNISVNPSAGVSVTPPGLTDASGETYALVKSYARADGDSVRVVGSVNVTGIGGVSVLTDTSYVTFAPLENLINSINVWAEPPVLIVSSGSTASSNVYARVLDNTNTAIKDLQVTFQASKGAITAPTLTDSTGVSMVTFYSNGDTGTVTITASAGDMNSMTTIQINQSSSSTGAISLWSSTTILYTDESPTTYAQIKATLWDADNQPIVGDTVRFSSSVIYAQVAGMGITDSTGTAYSTFNDLGFATFPDSAYVTAKYNKLGLSSSIGIMLMDQPEVYYIDLSSPKESGIKASGIDSTYITATIYLEGNAPAPSGLSVHFNTTNGTILPIDTLISQGGQATVRFVSGTTLDTAWVTAECNGVLSDPMAIPHIPGDPVGIDLVDLNPDTLIVGGPSGMVTIVVVDTSGHGVPNQQVNFSTTLGTISTMSITNAAGEATAFLAPQTQAGIAQVQAYANGIQDTLSVGYLITAGYPSSIQLTSNYATIQVQGTGGQEAATLTATVQDPNGNPVPDDILVVFELLEPIPDGARFDNSLHVDSSMTSAGLARVGLNSGTAAGPLKVKATTWMDYPNNQNPIQATKSNIVIASGPPYFIDIDYSNTPDQAGANGMGAAIQLEVNARISDQYGNNVSAGTAVFFEVDTVNQSIWHGNYATVDGSASIVDSTGNASTLLYYNSEATFKTVDLIVSCTGVGTSLISESEEVILPILGGELYLEAIPLSVTFVEANQISVHKVTATLVDDLGHYINNAKIVFTNNVGCYFCADSNAARQNLPTNWNQLAIWRAETYTGPDPIDLINLQVPTFHQEDGEAILFLRAQENTGTQFTPDYPPIFLSALQTEVIGEVEVSLSNSNITSDPVNITFRRPG